MKKKIIFLMIASVFLAFFNNLTFLFGTCYPGNTTDDMFVSSIFDSIKVVKTHSLTLGMQNLFVLIVFIFVMHDYLSREILNQGVYALVRMHRRTKWLVRRMAGLAVICAVYMGIYLTIVYELSSYSAFRSAAKGMAGIIYDGIFCGCVYGGFRYSDWTECFLYRWDGRVSCIDHDRNV